MTYHSAVEGGVTRVGAGEEGVVEQRVWRREKKERLNGKM